MKRRYKISIYTVVSLCTIVTSSWIFFSPYRQYKQKYNEIKNEVIVDAPVNVVYDYLGNSQNASRWSVFVDSIIPLNLDKVNDGHEGSVRRCYVKSKFMLQAFWDERLTEVVRNKKRQLSIYNLTNFSMTAEGLYTEQQYETFGTSKTRLTFSVFYLKDDVTFIEWVKTHLASYEINSIFVDNMNNIKQDIENGIAVK